MNGYELRKLKKRESILEAARDLFARYGSKKVSVTEIARKAGVNSVTIYNHFRDKGGLIREVVRGVVADDWNRARAILEGEQPFLEKLRAMIAAKIAPANLSTGTLIAAAVAEDKELADYVESLFRKKVNPRITKFIREGQKSGDVRRDLSVKSIRLYIDMFTGLVGTHPEFLTEKGRLGKSAQEIWNLFLNGLLGRPPDTVS